jgi:hypothetical protein
MSPPAPADVGRPGRAAWGPWREVWGALPQVLSSLSA